MKTIFIITEKESTTAGHGAFETIQKLATYGVTTGNIYTEKLYPAFTSTGDAEKFIDKVSPNWKPQITEISLL